MSDTDRLAALLAPMLPKYPNEWRDPEDIASDLIAAGVALAATPAPRDVRHCPACSGSVSSMGGHDVYDCAGVTLAATPAPLDEDWKALYDNAVEKVNDLWYAAQPILDAAMDVFPEEWIADDSSMAMPVTLRGRDVFALRAALAATPAPLDVMVAALDGLPRLWWCSGWGTLNEKRHHGNETACAGESCGNFAYVRDVDLRAALKGADRE